MDVNCLLIVPATLFLPLARSLVSWICYFMFCITSNKCTVVYQKVTYQKVTHFWKILEILKKYKYFIRYILNLECNIRNYSESEQANFSNDSIKFIICSSRLKSVCPYYDRGRVDYHQNLEFDIPRSPCMINSSWQIT